MHRLNGLQITAFPEREKTTPNKYKTLLTLLSLHVYLQAAGGRARSHTTSTPLDGCESVCACAPACLPVCVCVNPVRKGSKRPRAKNLSSVVSDFIHSRWREKEWGGRWRKMVGTNPPSHGWTRPGCTSHRLTVIRTRDASYGPPAHLRPVNHSLINHP